MHGQAYAASCRRRPDVTQVLDHVVELLDRLDAHGHDAVVLVRLVDGLLEPGRLERVVDQVGVLLQLAHRDVITASMLPVRARTVWCETFHSKELAEAV